MDQLEMIQYTDPMCIWCYAMEPAVRKLQVVLGKQLQYRNVCGLLVSDVRQVIGDDAYSDLRFEQLKMQMKDHFLEAARCSGVPVNPSWLAEAAKEDVTSLPMTLAFEAVKLQDPERADEFLWQCRANSHARKTIMSRRENLLKLAEQYASDKEKLLEDLKNGTAEQSLAADLQLCREKGIRSFPTMELVWKGRQMLIPGYRSYDELKAIIADFTDHQLQFEKVDFSLADVLHFIHRYKTVTSADLRLLYNLGDE